MPKYEEVDREELEALLGDDAILPDPMAELEAMSMPDNYVNESPLGPVGPGRRLLLKNLASRQGARKYLESFRDPEDESKPYYDVREAPPSFGADFNFFLKRRGSGDPWRPLDPAPGVLTDFMSDMGDLAYDALLGRAVFNAGGNKISLLRRVTGAGAVSGGMEALRQGAGSLAGIPGNVSPSEIVTAAGSTMAVELGLAGAGSAMRAAPVQRLVSGAKHLADDVAGRISGFAAVGNWSPGEVMRKRFGMKPGDLPSHYVAAGRVRDVISRLDDTRLPAFHSVKQMVDNAGPIRTNMIPVWEMIGKEATMISNTVRAPGLQNKMLDIATGVDEIVAASGENLDNLTIPTAIEIKRFLQAKAQDAGGFLASQGKKSEAQVVRNIIVRWARQTRRNINTSMVDGGLTNFPMEMRRWESQIGRLEYLKRAYGATSRTREEGMKKAEAAISTLFSGSKQAGWISLRNAERVLELNQGELTNDALQSSIRAAMGEATRGNVSRMSATLPILGLRVPIASQVAQGLAKAAPHVDGFIKTSASQVGRFMPAATAVVVSEEQRRSRYTEVE